jgi:hypothetical protein
MQPILSMAYAEYNDKFFKSALPICFLSFAELPFSERSSGTLARTTRITDTSMIHTKVLEKIPHELKNNLFVTQIDYRLMWNELVWLPTLLHEMNHILLYDEPAGRYCRSDIFPNGMKSLVECGAFDDIF